MNTILFCLNHTALCVGTKNIIVLFTCCVVVCTCPCVVYNSVNDDIVCEQI